MNIYKWRRVFGVDYAPGEPVWDLVLSGMAHDRSSKRDAMPSFGIDDSGVELRIFFGHRDPGRRTPRGPRYRVVLYDDNKRRMLASESHDDPAKAARAYRHLLDRYARIVANYRQETRR